MRGSGLKASRVVRVSRGGKVMAGEGSRGRGASAWKVGCRIGRICGRVGLKYGKGK